MAKYILIDIQKKVILYIDMNILIDIQIYAYRCSNMHALNQQIPSRET